MPSPQPVDWYQELKTWQSGLAALIALMGLILGALINAQLNRRRDRVLRTEEILAVSTALYGEMISMRDRLALMAEELLRLSRRKEDINDQFVKDYSPRAPVLYPALASKIGLLSHDLVLDITQFYDHFQTAKDNLPVLVKSETRPIPYHVVTVLRPAANAISDVRTALRKIERLARIHPAQDLDSGPVNAIASAAYSAVREWEEEQYQRELTEEQKRRS